MQGKANRRINSELVHACNTQSANKHSLILIRQHTYNKKIYSCLTSKFGQNEILRIATLKISKVRPWGFSAWGLEWQFLSNFLLPLLFSCRKDMLKKSLSWSLRVIQCSAKHKLILIWQHIIKKSNPALFWPKWDIEDCLHLLAQIFIPNKS